MSERPQYTPGPWSLEGLSVAVRGRGTIAACPSPKDGGVMECVANSRLIAAAPDLLAALNVMLNAIGNHPVTSVDEAEKIALSVIRKAKGES